MLLASIRQTCLRVRRPVQTVLFSSQAATEHTNCRVVRNSQRMNRIRRNQRKSEEHITSNSSLGHDEKGPSEFTTRNPNFHSQAKKGGFELVQGPRGHPGNVTDKNADAYEAVHPLVRTNPVTRWKGIFTGVNSLSGGQINGVAEREIEILKDYFKQLFIENHDLQVRNRWGQDDIAIWDDRSVVYVATNDYFGKRAAY